MEGDILYPSKRIVNRFGLNEKSGSFAEQYFHNNYFNALNLKFRKIKEDKVSKRPDGWIINRNKKIALVEIKLIKYKELKTGTGVAHRINSPYTIRRAINKAKNQLKNINTELPKIIYLLGDEIFFNEVSVRWAIFGPDTLIKRRGITLYSGPKGFVEEKYNLFRDTVLSAVICHLNTTKGYDLYLFKNSTSRSLPSKLTDPSHLKVYYDYNGNRLKKIK